MQLLLLLLLLLPPANGSFATSTQGCQHRSAAGSGQKGLSICWRLLQDYDENEEEAADDDDDFEGDEEDDDDDEEFEQRELLC